MTWETFQKPRRGRTASSTPEAWINGDNGTLRLNLAARNLLGQPSRVVVLYDRDEATIGVRAATSDDENPYAFRRGTVSIAALLLHYGVRVGKGPRPILDSDDPAIVAVPVRPAAFADPNGRSGSG